MVEGGINRTFSVLDCTKEQVIILQVLQIFGNECVRHASAVVADEVANIQKIICSIFFRSCVFIEQDCSVSVVDIAEFHVVRMGHIESCL